MSSPYNDGTIPDSADYIIRPLRLADIPQISKLHVSNLPNA